jgi:hypothetical protein
LRHSNAFRKPGNSDRLSDRGQYLLWLTEAEANRLAALRRYGESYSDAVIRMAKAQKSKTLWRAI